MPERCWNGQSWPFQHRRSPPLRPQGACDWPHPGELREGRVKTQNRGGRVRATAPVVRQGAQSTVEPAPRARRAGFQSPGRLLVRAQSRRRIPPFAVSRFPANSLKTHATSEVPCPRRVAPARSDAVCRRRRNASFSRRIMELFPRPDIAERVATLTNGEPGVLR
jgi:hypothetical protein